MFTCLLPYLNTPIDQTSINFRTTFEQACTYMNKVQGISIPRVVESRVGIVERTIRTRRTLEPTVTRNRFAEDVRDLVALLNEDAHYFDGVRMWRGAKNIARALMQEGYGWVNEVKVRKAVAIRNALREMKAA